MAVIQKKMVDDGGEEMSATKFHELFDGLIQMSVNEKQKQALKDIRKAMFYKLGEEISESDCKKLGGVLDFLLNQLHSDLEQTNVEQEESLTGDKEEPESVSMHDLSSITPNAHKNNNATFMSDTMNNNTPNVLPYVADAHA